MQENNLIEVCRKGFGQPPRKFSSWERLTYLKPGKPLWLRRSTGDGLAILFEQREKLLVEGEIVWAYIVQANQLLFEPGTENCPGVVVYSVADADRADPQNLREVAQSLYSLKGTTPEDPELRSFAAHLTDEMTRMYGLVVPPSVSPNLRCRVSCTFFFRKHLPYRRLCCGFFPAVAGIEEPHYVLPLPAKYWPAELVRWWSR